ncbi:MAG: hypothetical protein V4805_14330, partial [Pseudomonadota bacterium]
MVSIIRAPEISDQKRRLSTRRNPAQTIHADSTSANTLTSGTLQSGAIAEPRLFSAQEVEALVEQGRLALLQQFKEEVESACEQGRQQGVREGLLVGAEEARNNVAAQLERIGS